MNECEFELELEELCSAEDFLDYFGIVYDPSMVQVNRLHILQRFHDYIASETSMPRDGEGRRERHAHLLNCAYNDFVDSDAVTEKVFRVFRPQAPVKVEIPLSELMSSASKV